MFVERFSKWKNISWIICCHIQEKNLFHVMFVWKHLHWKNASRFTPEYTLVRNRTAVKNVVHVSLRKVASLLTGTPIRDTDLTHASTVDWNLFVPLTCRLTWCDIQVKRHFVVASVAENLDEETLWRSTCRFIQATNHIYVRYVENVLHRVRTLKSTLQLIQKINHSCV